MSFKNALEVLENRVGHFDEVRTRSMRSLTRSRAVAFDSIYELLSKVSSLVRSVSHLEASLSQEQGYRKVCGNGLLIRSFEGSIFMKFKPLRMVAYSATSNTVKLSYGSIGVEIAGDTITITLGKLARSLRYMDPADVANNSAVYSSLLSRVIAVPDELSRTVSSCAKAMGVRL